MSSWKLIKKARWLYFLQSLRTTHREHSMCYKGIKTHHLCFSCEVNSPQHPLKPNSFLLCIIKLPYYSTP